MKASMICIRLNLNGQHRIHLIRSYRCKCTWGQVFALVLLRTELEVNRNEKSDMESEYLSFSLYLDEIHLKIPKLTTTE